MIGRPFTAHDISVLLIRLVPAAWWDQVMDCEHEQYKDHYFYNNFESESMHAEHLGRLTG